ncbi:unnamed protein product, partial [Prorocentrum cordatum]
RVSFGHGPRGNRLAVASGRSVRVVDVDVGGGGEERAAPRGRASAPCPGTCGPSLRWTGARARQSSSSATCAEDCRFFIWDMRQGQRAPAQALLSPAPWTAAVRWSPLQDQLLATGHEDTICVWDTRSSSQHMSVLAPGQSRVLAVDWSLHDRDTLLSVSAQPRGSGGCVGSIKVWDVAKIWDADSPARTHTCIDIDNGMPSAARFLPFGPAVLVAVDKSVVVLSLDGGSGRRAVAELHRHEHEHAVSSVCFAPRGGGEWRLVSMSQAGRTLASWNFRPPVAMQLDTVAAMPRLEPKQSSPMSPLMTPEIGPASSPLADRMTQRVPTMRTVHEDDIFFGCLANLQELLKKSQFVEYHPTSYREMTEGRVEYRLRIEMAIEVEPGKFMRPVVTIGVDPAAPAARSCVAARLAREQPPWDKADPGEGVSHRVDWQDFKGGCDGPLAPGTIEETFRRYVSLQDLMQGGQGLCDCVEALAQMLRRRDCPPRLPGVKSQEARSPASEAGAQRGRARGELPFPRTCGACWSPKGDLLWFASLQRVTVPIPRRWSSLDYSRVMRIHGEHARNELLLANEAEVDEHTRTARELKVDHSVRFIPARWLQEKVEDHWWTMVASDFACEPTPTMPLASDLCRHNRQTALDIGRADLAEVWRLADSLLDGAPGSAGGPWSRPFAARLLQRVVQQLFDSQETLTLALVGVVLLCAGPALAPVLGGGAVPEAEPVARTDTATTAARPRARRRGGRACRPAEARPQPGGLEGARSLAGAERAEFTEAIRLGSALTWAPANTPSWGRQRVRTSSRSLRQTISDTTRGEGPWSADSTMNTCPAREGDASWSRQVSPFGGAPLFGAPAVVDRRREEPSAAELVFRDAATVERLLHSAYAHCDLLHRLGEFCASRAMAKLLCRLHELPFSEASYEFGRLRRTPPRGGRRA